MHRHPSSPIPIPPIPRSAVVGAALAALLLGCTSSPDADPERALGQVCGDSSVTDVPSHADPRDRASDTALHCNLGDVAIVADQYRRDGFENTRALAVEADSGNGDSPVYAFLGDSDGSGTGIVVYPPEGEDADLDLLGTLAQDGWRVEDINGHGLRRCRHLTLRIAFSDHEILICENDVRLVRLAAWSPLRRAHFSWDDVMSTSGASAA